MGGRIARNRGNPFAGVQAFVHHLEKSRSSMSQLDVPHDFTGINAASRLYEHLRRKSQAADLHFRGVSASVS